MDLSLFPDQPEGRKTELSKQPAFDFSQFPDQPLPEAPSYGEVAWTGLRESLAGGLKPYEAPFKPVARALGIPPGLELSEWIKPSEEEERRAAEASIPKQVARGLAGLPGAILKYGPAGKAVGMMGATGKTIAPVAAFVLPEVTQAISEGKTPLEVGQTAIESAIMGLGFKYLPGGRLFRVPGMAGLFGAQAFYENMKQGVPISEALKGSIAPATVGGIIGLLPSGRRRIVPPPEERPLPTGPEVRPPLEGKEPPILREPTAGAGADVTEAMVEKQPSIISVSPDIKRQVNEVLIKQLGYPAKRAQELTNAAAIRKPNTSTPEELFDEVFRREGVAGKPQYRLTPTVKTPKPVGGIKEQLKNTAVIDEQGEPLVVYHGAPKTRTYVPGKPNLIYDAKVQKISDEYTKETEDIFKIKNYHMEPKLYEIVHNAVKKREAALKALGKDPSEGEWKTGEVGYAAANLDPHSSWDIGVHFGTKKQALVFAGDYGEIFPVYLNIKNLVEIPDVFARHDQYVKAVNTLDGLGALKEGTYHGLVSKAEKLEEITSQLEDYRFIGENPAYKRFWKSLASSIKKSVEGFKYLNEVEDPGQYSYVALDKKQIIPLPNLTTPAGEAGKPQYRLAPVGKEWKNVSWDKLTDSQKKLAEDKYVQETGDEARFAKESDWWLNTQTGELGGRPESQYRLAPTWYSTLQRTIENIKSESIPVEQLNSIAKGAKSWEVEETGFNEWLSTKKGKVNKAEALDYLKQREVRVEDVTKGGKILPENQIQIDKLIDRLEEIQVERDSIIGTSPVPKGEGLETLRDRMDTLFLERQKLEQQVLSLQKAPITSFGPEQAPSLNLPGGENYQEKFLTLPNIKGFEWRDGHGAYADIKNPIVRLRFDRRTDANGRKGLFFQEMQPPRPEEQAKMPDWVKSKWREMAVRKMVRMGAEENAEWIGWTTGEQQAVRYDLSKQVDRITWNKDPSGGGGIYVAAHPIGITEPITKTLQPNEIADFVGKDIAEKINTGGSYGTLKGVDLKVGGEGLKRIYDQDFPNVANTLGKKWGAKVGETEIDTGAIEKPSWERVGEGGLGKLVVHSLDITPSMRESALGEGFPMFRAGKEAPGSRPLPDWAREDMIRRGLDPNRPFNDIDIGNPSVIEAIKNDPTLTLEQKNQILKTGSIRIGIPPEGIAPLPIDTVRSIIDKRTSELKNAPSVMITETSEEFPKSVKGAPGMYDPNTRTIWVARDRMISETEVINTINHEAIGHYALNSFMNPSFDPFLNRVFMKYGRIALEKEMSDLGYKFNFDTREGRLNAAREKLAMLTETNADPGLLKQMYAWIREQLAKVFPGMEITDAEIQKVISQAKGKMESGTFKFREERIDSLRKQVRNIQAIYQPKEPFEYRLTRKDVTDWLTPGMNIGRDFKSGVASLMLPTSKSPEHLHAAEVLGSKLGPMMRDSDIASRTLSADKKMFTKMGTYDINIPLPENVGMKFASEMSTGNVEPRFQPIANRINNLFAKLLTNLEKAGAPLETIRENYFPGIWTKPSIRAFNMALKEGLERGNGTADRKWVYDRTKEILAQGGGEEGKYGLEYLSKRPFRGKESFRKQKVFDDIMDAVEWGLEPVSRNPIELAELKMREMGRSLMFNRWRMEEEGKGNLINVNNSGIPLKKSLRAGFDRFQWGRINDPYGTIWHKSPDTGLLEKIGNRLAKKPVADIVNNYLSTSLYNTPHFGGAYRAYMWTAAILNQFQLGLGSAFHAGFTTIDAQVSTHAMVLKDIYGLARGNRTLDDLGRTMKRVPLSFAKWTTEGKHIVNEWETPTMEVPTNIAVGKLPSTQEGRVAIVTKAIEIAGGGFEFEHGLRTREIGPMVQNWYGGNKVKAVLRSPFALVELSAKPIMEWLVPKQKAGVFGEAVGRIIEQYPNKTLMELRPEFREAWNFVDRRMGQVRWDRIFMNNVAKNVVQSLFRAAGWTGGTIGEIGGSIIDTARFFKEWVRTGKPPAELPDRIAYTIALMTTVATANALLTMAFTGDKASDLEPIDFWAFRTGELDDRMRKERFLLPTYMKDIYAWQHDWSKTLINKTHPLISLISDIAKNKDYYGVRIWDPDDELFMRSLNAGGYVSKQFIPFWMRGMQMEAERGGGFAETFKEHPLKMMMPEVGIMPAPAYFTASKAEQLASELTMRHLPSVGITKTQRARTDLVKEFARRFNKGESQESLLAEMQVAIGEGKLDRTDLARIKQRIVREPMEQTIMKLSLREALRVWDIANPDERLKISPYIMRKFWRSRSPEEREEAMPMMPQIMGGIPTGGMPPMEPERFSIMSE